MQQLKNIARKSLLIAVLLLIVLVATASADHSEFQVSIDSGNNNYWDNPAIAMDKDGNFVVVWEENSGILLQGRDIMARRYLASGTAVDLQPFTVNDTTSGSQTNPDVAMDNNGNFVIVWQSNGSPNTESIDIIGLRFNSNDQTWGDEFRVNTTTAGQQSEPSIAMDSDGDFVVVYQSDTLEGLGADVLAQRFNSDGTPAGSEFRVHEAPENSQVEPDVAMDGNGNFVVIWRDYNSNLGLGPIFFRQFNSNGVAQGNYSRYLVSERGEAPAVAANDAGQFTVVWEKGGDDPPSGATGIFGQRYDEFGSGLGITFLVNTSTYGWQREPDVSMSNNGFVIAWHGFSGRSNDSIYVQAFDGQGLKYGPEHRFNERFDNFQQLPAIAMDDSGLYAAAWRGDEQINSQLREIGIFGRVLDGPPLNNTAPQANDDEYSIHENETLTVPAPGVLINDSDPEGSPLSAINRTPPTSGGGSSFNFETNGSFSYTPPLNFSGTKSFTYIAGDDTLDSNIATVTITVEAANTPPTADAGGPYNGYEGSPIPLDGSGSDDTDGDQLSYNWIANSTLCEFDDPTVVSPTLTCVDNGNYQVTLEVSDGEATASATASIEVSNVAPTAILESPVNVDEGSAFQLALSGATDPSTDDLAAGFEYAFDCGDGSGYGAFSANSSANCQTSDNGSRTVKATIRDKDGAETEYTALVEVQNVDPSIDFIAAPEEAVLVDDQPLEVNVQFSDPGADMHEVTWNWGDGTPTDAQTDALSPVTQVHTYDETGIYTLTVTVTDDDGGQAIGQVEIEITAADTQAMIEDLSQDIQRLYEEDEIGLVPSLVLTSLLKRTERRLNLGYHRLAVLSMRTFLRLVDVWDGSRFTPETASILRTQGKDILAAIEALNAKSISF